MVAFIIAYVLQCLYKTFMIKNNYIWVSKKSEFYIEEFPPAVDNKK